MERDLTTTDELPTGQGAISEVRAEEQVTHVWFGCGSLGHAKGRATESARDEVMF